MAWSCWKTCLNIPYPENWEFDDRDSQTSVAELERALPSLAYLVALGPEVSTSPSKLIAREHLNVKEVVEQPLCEKPCTGQLTRSVSLSSTEHFNHRKGGTWAWKIKALLSLLKLDILVFLVHLAYAETAKFLLENRHHHREGTDGVRYGDRTTARSSQRKWVLQGGKSLKFENIEDAVAYFQHDERHNQGLALRIFDGRQSIRRWFPVSDYYSLTKTTEPTSASGIIKESTADGPSRYQHDDSETLEDIVIFSATDGFNTADGVLRVQGYQLRGLVSNTGPPCPYCTEVVLLGRGSVLAFTSRTGHLVLICEKQQIREGVQCVTGLTTLNAEDLAIPMDAPSISILTLSPACGLCGGGAGDMPHQGLMLLYMHNDTESLEDSFTVQLTDGKRTVQGTLYIYIMPVNDEIPHLSRSMGLETETAEKSQSSAGSEADTRNASGDELK
ncbi:hypothetical protein BTVI_15504 [Pitangus sulphuratus]|nr:hypothetical protein BTVI_15504 [Pitangus sulphuratus]